MPALEALSHSEPNFGIQESNDAKSIRFKTNLIGIQSRPLNPENIDTYAQDALSGLVDLTASVVSEYLDHSEIIPDTEKELEDKAFEFYSLSKIGDLLDHVVAKSDEIRHIGEIVERAENMGSVIVPPQELVVPVGNGNGGFEKKLVIPRTKTLLFILANDFDVDLDDPEQVSLRTGVLSDSMMRGLSYFMINIPGLNRTVLCCDEEGNVTYVFDNAVLNGQGISPEDLTTLTKADINDLIASDPKMGKRIIYSSGFVPKMVGLMSDLQTDNPTAEPRGLYLYPKAPEGVLSAASFADKIGMADATIVKSVRELGENLGATQNYKFGSKATAGYTPKQQEIIRQHLKDKGLLAEQPSEGMLSAQGIADSLGISSFTVRRAIVEIGTELGEVNKYRFGTSTPTTGYTPEQQEVIRQHLINRGLLMDRPPEGVLSVKGIAESLGVTSPAVESALKKIGGRIGPTQNYKFRSVTATGYTREQQEIIMQYLGGKIFSELGKPMGMVSVAGFAEELGVSSRIVSRAVKELGENLGEVQYYRFGSIYAKGYSPDQQQVIRQYLESKGSLSSQAPEGILSAKGLAGQLGVAQDAVSRIIDELVDSLGPTNNYKFGSMNVVGYTPEQQELIRQSLGKRGIFSEQAPEGVLSVRRLADELGIAPQTLRKSINKLRGEMGVINTFRFGSRYTEGFSPEQQEMIRQYVERTLPPPPEGFVSIKDLSSRLGLSEPTISRAIYILGEGLGETKTFKFKSQFALGLSPEQQEIIARELERKGLITRSFLS